MHWVIYDHPSDHPLHYVARQWQVHPDGPRPTKGIILSEDLEMLRRTMLTLFGLACFARSPQDDPAIVETWL